MLPSPGQFESPIKERKSRRSHKNSKDGCPNCRANRVKCGEQLPSCGQCVKKRLRCGYLDFPAEKLAHIRKKNEMLMRNPEDPEVSVKESKKTKIGRKPLPMSPSEPLRHTPSTIYSVPLQTPKVPQVVTGVPVPHQIPSYSAPPRPVYSATPPSLFASALPGPNRLVASPPAGYNPGPYTPQGPIYQHSQSQEQLPHRVSYSAPYLPPTRDVARSPAGIPYFHAPKIVCSRPQVHTHPYHRQSIISPVLSSRHWAPESRLQKPPSIYNEKRDTGSISMTEQRFHSFPSLSPQSAQDGPASPLPPIATVKQESVLSPESQVYLSPAGTKSGAKDGEPKEFDDVKQELHHSSQSIPASRDGRKRHKSRNSDAKNSKSASFSTNFRSVVYSNMLHNVTHDLTALEDHVPPNFKLWGDGDPFYSESNDFSGPDFSGDFSMIFGTSSDSGSILPENLKPSQESQKSHSSAESNDPSLELQNQKCLPGCVISTAKFDILEVPRELQSKWYEETVKDLTQQGARIRFKTLLKSNYLPPVYSGSEFRALWIEIFLRAATFELFFIYFIDKSINILMRASSKVVNSDAVFSPSSDTPSSCSSSYSMTSKSTPHFFYNKEDLNILTAKSYATYGRVIRELRNSITMYSSEFPARMSLFSAWACYTNPQSDLNTFDLMIRGSLLLLKSSLAQCIADKSPVFSMHREFSLLESFARQSLLPDYTLNSLRGIVDDFERYYSFVKSYVRLHDYRHDFGEEISNVISDPVFRHDLHELRKFLQKLLTHYTPQMMEQNRLCKASRGYEADQNIHFVSPILLFELTYEWCCIYPDEKMHLNSKISPIKRTLYMFYHALAKCLAHVLTPMKSVSIADPCNVTCTKVGMKFTKPDALDDVEYRDLQPLLRNLMRTVRFFDVRSTLLSFHIFDRSVLDREYIRLVPCVAPTKWDHADLVEILPAKLKLREEQVENFSQTIFGAHNFPFFGDLYDDPTTADMIRQETERQCRALQNEPYRFDYTVGYSNHDFNPSEIVDRYCSERKNVIDKSPEIPKEKLSVRIDNMLSSRDAIANASKSQVPPA